MTNFSIASGLHQVSRLKTHFKARDCIVHDGRDLQRFSPGARTQARLARVAAVTMCFSTYGVAQAAVGAVALTGAVDAPLSPEGRVAQMQGRLVTMQADVAMPLKRVEAKQVAVAAPARHVANQRFARALAHVRSRGVTPERLMPTQAAMGGPFEAADSAAAEADLRADTQFRSLFMTWKKLDGLEQSVIAVPSAQPVDHLAYTSNYGIRSDPFRGVAAMHAGVDIPGPVGTPVYATADGIVDRAERAGGYGNLVELDHGKGIQTRYGHLSKLLVEAGTRVHRGQLIALMGSTGRSTGPHLHYEVRIDGHAVNPVPFLQTADFMLAAQDKTINTIPVAVGPVAQGGPAAD